MERGLVALGFFSFGTVSVCVRAETNCTEELVENEEEEELFVLQLQDFPSFRCIYI